MQYQTDEAYALAQAAVASLRVGETTPADARVLLGPPYNVSTSRGQSDLHVFYHYRWSQIAVVRKYVQQHGQLPSDQTIAWMMGHDRASVLLLFVNNRLARVSTY